MKFSIGKRLFFGFGGLLLIVLIFGIYIIVTSQQNKIVSEKIINIYAPSKTLLNKYYNTIDNSKMLIKSWVFIDKIPETPDKLRLVNLHDSIFPALVKELSQIKSKWNEEDENLADEITKQVEDTLFAQHKVIIGHLNSFEAYDDPVVFLEAQFAVEDGGEVIEMTQKILDKISILQGRINKQVANANTELNNSYESFQTYIVILLILLLITSTITGFFTSRSILLPVNKLKNILDSMSKGEIIEIKNIDTGDEIGQMSLSLNNVVKQLRKTISDIKDSTIFLSNHSKTLTRQASILSNGATEQAASVQEINSSIERIVSNLDTNAKNSKLAETLVLNFVDSIKNNSSNVSKTVDALYKISEKVNDVNDIAFQTNILSLNASIEAARAGIHGKGFGVVALEVGKLAERSKNHANEIESLSSLSINIAKTTDNDSNELIPQIQNTQKLIGNITDAISELSSGVVVINKTAVHLKSIAQQNASFSSDMSGNSKNLEEHIEKLMNSVSFFKIENEIPNPDLNKEAETVKEHKMTNNTQKNIEADKLEENKPVKNITAANTEESGFNLNLGEDTDDNFETF
ncbi:MAG: hypothetical protein DRJ10_10400 [Bacteroidetes bacterium]|nr:MAG: hypothetical protein DRJ10_10400 [Bacteroidota bacterium]